MSLTILSMDDIKEIVSKWGYAEAKTKTIYFCKLDLPFEESLVAIESDAEVRELIGLLKMVEFVYVYV